MIIRRKRNSRFTVVGNHVPDDERLSFEAVGVLTYLLSRPDNWQVHTQQLSSRGGCGRDKVRKILGELINAGYVRRQQVRSDDGRRIEGTIYIVYDEPEAAEAVAETVEADDKVAAGQGPENPGLDDQGTGSQGPENQGPEKASPEERIIDNKPGLSPKLRESARDESPDEGKPETLPPDDTPGRADFQKRVMRFCSGRGFVAGPWKDWDVGGSIDYIAAQMAALTPEERKEAERWRDPYLTDCADRKKDPQPPGVWLKGKVWSGLDAAVMDRFEKRRQAQLQPDERAKPDGWAASVGPVGMAWLFGTLLAGQRPGVAPLGTFFIEAQLRAAWPAVVHWKELLQTRGGTVFSEQWHALKEAMEPVPHGTEMAAAWKKAFAARAWPWLPAFDSAPVFYAPKGGPDRLDAFKAALGSPADSAETRKAG